MYQITRHIPANSNTSSLHGENLYLAIILLFVLYLIKTHALTVLRVFEKGNGENFVRRSLYFVALCRTR